MPWPGRLPTPLPAAAEGTPVHVEHGVMVAGVLDSDVQFMPRIPSRALREILRLVGFEEQAS